jgi:hypothetical protein
MEAPTQEELLWALSTVMDGVKEHEIVSMTGISEEEASRLNQIASRAIEFSLANCLY